MKPAFLFIGIAFIMAVALEPASCQAHDIIFCGEKIPVQNSQVADKLMNVIRRQMGWVNLPQLRQRVKQNFPTVEYYLRETGLPEDFKYLAIVESGFQNAAISPAGARGFWQLMPATARELGLTISDLTDERDDIYKSTYAACKVLASFYLTIKKKYGVSSWVLTAAAYNFGIGNISNIINRQGNDYFSMSLNPETAMYVYKIIALKELFEYPELYMKDFGYNVFNGVSAPSLNGNAAGADTALFKTMVINVKQNDGKHPGDIKLKEPSKPAPVNLEQKNTELNWRDARYLAANIQGRYKNFADGDLVTIELLENMDVNGSFSRKGSQLKGKGWLIDDRVFIDLGYGSHDVVLLDVSGQKGIPLSALKGKTPLLLKIKNNTE